MPKTPPTLASLPPRIIDFLREACKRRITLLFPTKGSAIRFRQDAYHARKLILQHPDHPAYPIATLAKYELHLTQPSRTASGEWEVIATPNSQRPDSLNTILDNAGVPRSSPLPSAEEPSPPATNPLNPYLSEDD